MAHTDVSRSTLIRPRAWAAHACAAALLALVLGVMAWSNSRALASGSHRWAAEESWLFLLAFGISTAALAELWARGRDAQRLAESNALVDALTRLPNRPASDSHLHALLSSARRHGTDLGLLMVDVDHFRRVNSNFGHLAGDHVLRALGTRVQGCLRGEDFAGRWGGEEFVILLPMTDQPGTLVVGDRVREAIAHEMKSSTGMDLSVTASIGAVLSGPGEDALSLLGRAAEALHQARQQGRNCVVFVPTPVADTATSVEVQSPAVAP